MRKFLLGVAMGVLVSGCGSGNSGFGDDTSSDAAAGDGSLSTLDDAGTPSTGDANKSGCNAVDVLFVLDSSGSMCTHQQTLAQAFPKFVDAIFDSLPSGTNVHVGITASSFCESGSHSNNNCVPGETPQDIAAHFTPPDVQMLPENGWQGRLFEFQNKHFFDADTSNPSTRQPLKDWFTGAATGVGCQTCGFDCTVGATEYAFSPANAATNAGFVRDEGAVFVLFLLTDDVDETPSMPDPVKAAHDAIVAAKTKCGGEACILAGGLFAKACATTALAQNFRLVSSFGKQPIWGDIGYGNQVSPDDYAKVLADALTPVVKKTCDMIQGPR